MLWVLGYYFWEIYIFSRTGIFSLFSAEPLYQNVRIDHRIIFDFFFYENHCKSQVESWVFGFSLIFDFSVYLSDSSRITFPPPRVGDHFQVLKVSEGTCTVLRTVPTIRYCVGYLLYGGAWGDAGFGKYWLNIDQILTQQKLKRSLLQKWCHFSKKRRK